MFDEFLSWIYTNKKEKQKAGFCLKYKTSADIWIAGYGSFGGSIESLKERGHDKYVGIGDTPEEALNDLKTKLNNHEHYVRE